MKAKTIKGKSVADIQAALFESLSEDFKPTLAIVFISVKQNSEAVCSLLDDQGIKVFGWDAPSIGFFSYGEFGKSKKGKHEFHNNTCCVIVLKEKARPASSE